MGAQPSCFHFPVVCNGGAQYDVPIAQFPTVGHGDIVEITCTYDNSRFNPFVERLLTEFNLTAPFDIVGGGNSYDEMCLGIVGTLDP